MSQSVAWRCKAPMAMGRSSWAVRTQACWHRISVGQTRAQLPPKMFSSRIFSAAPFRFPVAMRRMKPGMSIPVGQA